MKPNIIKIACLAFVILFKNTTSAETGAFIEEEENFYQMAVQRQIAAANGDPENPDKKTIRFALSVYGEYFGSAGILASIDYLIYLKQHSLETSEEFRLIKKRIKAWGRKTAMTIVANPLHFTGAAKDDALEIAKDMEGQKWENLRKDALYTKTAAFWNDTTKLKPMGANRPLVFIEKVIIMNNGELNVQIDNGGFISSKAGRATITKGKLASCEMSFFTDLSVEEISKARFSNAVGIDSGFGKELIAWRGDSKDGLLQVIRAKKQENGGELFTLKSTGFERPLMSASVKELSDEDLSILTMRGIHVVDEFARKIDYTSHVSVSRFGSRLDAVRLQSILKENGGMSGLNLEPFLIIYADILPLLVDEVEYREYNDLLKRFKQ